MFGDVMKFFAFGVGFKQRAGVGGSQAHYRNVRRRQRMLQMPAPQGLQLSSRESLLSLNLAGEMQEDAVTEVSGGDLKGISKVRLQTRRT